MIITIYAGAKVVAMARGLKSTPEAGVFDPMLVTISAQTGFNIA